MCSVCSKAESPAWIKLLVALVLHPLLSVGVCGTGGPAPVQGARWAGWLAGTSHQPLVPPIERATLPTKRSGHSAPKPLLLTCQPNLEPHPCTGPAGLTSPQLQQAALLFPLYLLQNTAGWLLLPAAAPHLGDLMSLATLLNLLQLARCTASRAADDEWHWA
jgi:hypothetical protein